MIRRRVFVSGRVQGVGFRASTVRAAAKHPALGGFVRNLADGRVEALFQGPRSEVEAMIAFCRKGPLLARVTGLEVLEEEPDPGLPREFGQAPDAVS